MGASDTGRRGPASDVLMPRWMTLACAILIQVVLALAMQEYTLLGLVHAVAIFLVGAYAILRGNLALLMCVLAYITGSEVLWRQVRAPVFHLMAPYMFILLSGFAVLFVLRRLSRDGRLAALYIALLLPATVATVRTAGEGARELISFALSGPLALAAFLMFTSQMKIRPWLYRRVLWVTLMSSLGPLTIALWNVRSELAQQGAIDFSGQSNFATSGGFGPVQVSSALSLGIMAAILLIISERDRVARLVASVLAVVLTVQTLLTFSRGGTFSVAIAVSILAVVKARDRRVRNRIIAIASASLLIANFLVFPWLEEFTGGAFEERFADTQSSRTELAANDTEIFTDNIVFGVGPGMTKYQRLTYEICQIRSDNCDNEASSHTEFTRMLGEHGIPGLVSMVLLVSLALNAVRRKGPGHAFAVAWIAWAIAQMFYANLRVVAVPFAFGLAFLHLTGAQRPPPGAGHPDSGGTPTTPPGRGGGPARGAVPATSHTKVNGARLNGTKVATGPSASSRMNGTTLNGTTPDSGTLNGTRPVGGTIDWSSLCDVPDPAPDAQTNSAPGPISPDAVIPPPDRPPPYRPRPVQRPPRDQGPRDGD